MFLTVGAALQRLPSYDRVLDVACGPMALAPTFAGKDYIGVDASEKNLRLGRSKYPGTPAICTRMEDISPNLVGDVVLCVQCIGYNEYFQLQNTILCVNKLADATRTSGTLIINLGARVREFFGEAEASLTSKFESVEVVRYGRFQERSDHWKCLALGYLMFYLPSIARSSSNPERLFICRGRR